MERYEQRNSTRIIELGIGTSCGIVREIMNWGTVQVVEWYKLWNGTSCGMVRAVERYGNGGAAEWYVNMSWGTVRAAEWYELRNGTGNLGTVRAVE